MALISGGGAGHEPAHAAYVGPGLLTAAVSGNIFASPSVAQILESIKQCGGSAGTVMIIKNYTGDIFHFHSAAEKARALYGKRVEIVIVGDDVAVGRKKSGKVGRRGLAGTVLVHKILGAMSAAGKSIDDIVKMGRSVTDGLVTCGVAQGHVQIPGSSLAEEEKGVVSPELELGMGIHNEPGCVVLHDRPNIDTLLDTMLDYLEKNDDTDRSYVSFDGAESVVLLVNNLGALSVLELNAIANSCAKKLGAFPVKFNIRMLTKCSRGSRNPTRKSNLWHLYDKLGRVWL